MARGRHDYETAVITVESESYTDRHGRIILQDDFEDTPFKWAGTGTGTHFETRQQRAAYNGSLGAELDITSDAPPGERNATITRHIPIDVTERLLLELFWRANDLTRLNQFAVVMHFYDGERRHYASINYDRANSIWQYWNDAGGVVNIPGSNQRFFNNAWNELTISVDFTIDHYVRFKSNNVEVIMGALPLQNAASGIGAHTEISIVATNITGNQLLMDIDDVVIRELEV